MCLESPSPLFSLRAPPLLTDEKTLPIGETVAPFGKQVDEPSAPQSHARSVGRCAYQIAQLTAVHGQVEKLFLSGGGEVDVLFLSVSEILYGFF